MLKFLWVITDLLPHRRGSSCFIVIVFFCFISDLYFKSSPKAISFCVTSSQQTLTISTAHTGIIRLGREPPSKHSIMPFTSAQKATCLEEALEKQGLSSAGAAFSPENTSTDEFPAKNTPQVLQRVRIGEGSVGPRLNPILDEPYVPGNAVPELGLLPSRLSWRTTATTFP